MIKVMYVLNSLHVGGAETFTLNLIRTLNKKIDYSILVTKGRRGTRYEEELGDRVCYCSLKPKQIIKNNFITYKEINKIKPDIIHVNDSVLLNIILALILGYKGKVIYTVHTTPKNDARGIKKLLYIFIFNIFSVKVVAINELLRLETMKYYHLSECVKIENGIFLEKYNTFDRDHIQLKNPCFIHIGSFTPVKNHEFLINVFEKVYQEYSTARLILLGSGPLENHIKSLVMEKKLSGNVQFMGNVSNVSDFLSVADIFLFPSKFEGAPMALIEAMASGLPIVASNRGGIPDMIENKKNGFLCELNVTDFYLKIDFLLKNSEVANEMKKNNKKKSQKYNIINTATEYYNVYNSLLKNDDEAYYEKI